MSQRRSRGLTCVGPSSPGSSQVLAAFSLWVLLTCQAQEIRCWHNSRQGLLFMQIAGDPRWESRWTMWRRYFPAMDFSSQGPEILMIHCFSNLFNLHGVCALDWLVASWQSALHYRICLAVALRTHCYKYCVQS